MRKGYTIGLIVLTAMLVSCEKWYETADVSHVSSLPLFTLEGGDFISIIKQDSGEFEDPGATAWVNGSEVMDILSLQLCGRNDTGRLQCNLLCGKRRRILQYRLRIVAVTHEDVSSNDLSGTYAGTNWEEVEVAVIRVNEGGLYKMEDIMGFPGYPMPGRFVDLGQEELILLPGEGYFGEYDASVGQYTNRTLSWDVILLTAPYEGYVIPVTWRKVE